MPSATIRMDGDILDSLLLPKVLDLIVNAPAEYAIEQITIGRTRHDASHAVIRVDTGDDATLAALLTEVQAHGAVVIGRGQT